MIYHLIEDNSACPDICWLPPVLNTLKDFRSKVELRSCFSVQHVIVIFEHLTDSEICQLYLILITNQDVFRLNVSMHYMGNVMAVLQRAN